MDVVKLAFDFKSSKGAIMSSRGKECVLVTIDEMAGWFGISPLDAIAIIVQGAIPCTIGGEEVLVCERALNAWIEQQFNFPARAPHAVKFGNFLPINEKEDYDDGRESFVFGR